MGSSISFLASMPLQFSGKRQFFPAVGFDEHEDDLDARSEASATRSAPTDVTDDDLNVDNENELEPADHDCTPMQLPQEVPTYLSYSTVVEDSTVVEEWVGNTGFYCSNWGKRCSKPNMQANIDIQLKTNPAQILAINECSRLTELVLMSAEKIEPPPDCAIELVNRPQWAYNTLRINEAHGNLLAVRKTSGTLKLLDWERAQSGTVRYKSSRTNVVTKKPAYNRTLIGEINLFKPLALWGNRIAVAVTHFHNLSAKLVSGHRISHKDFLDALARRILHFGIVMLMGDFNMALLKMRQELHSRGVRIQLLAWYPWRNTSGKTILDSLGIFSVNIHVSIRLHHSLSSFDDEANLLDAKIEATIVADDGDNVVTKRVDSYEGIDGPPGIPLHRYLPKFVTDRDKIETALKPAYSVEEDAGSEPRPMKEKRLESDTHFVYQGKVYKDAHFPLMVFTDNKKSRRSSEALKRRAQTSYV